MSTWPQEITEWREQQVAENSTDPWFHYLLEVENEVRRRFGIDPSSDDIPKPVRDFAWSALALPNCASDRKLVASIKESIAEFKRGAN